MVKRNKKRTAGHRVDGQSGTTPAGATRRRRAGASVRSTPDGARCSFRLEAIARQGVADVRGRRTAAPSGMNTSVVRCVLGVLAP
jgi:hypothetical protein